MHTNDISYTVENEIHRRNGGFLGVPGYIGGNLFITVSAHIYMGTYTNHVGRLSALPETAGRQTVLKRLM